MYVQISKHMIQNSKFKIQNSSKNGFTLFELIVVMAIISIMSAVVISGYSSQRDSKALSLGENQITNDIRIVQSRSYNILSTNGTSFPKGGYGIKFTKDSDKYTVFADNNNDGVHNGDEDSENDGDEDFEIIKLPKNVKVSNLKKNGSDIAGPVDIVFQPPYGRVLIDGSEKSAGSFIKFEIEIKNKGGFTKTIEVSSSRLIK